MKIFQGFWTLLLTARCQLMLADIFYVLRSSFWKPLMALSVTFCCAILNGTKLSLKSWVRMFKSCTPDVIGPCVRSSKRSIKYRGYEPLVTVEAFFLTIEMSWPLQLFLLLVKTFWFALLNVRRKSLKNLFCFAHFGFLQIMKPLFSWLNKPFCSLFFSNSNKKTPEEDNSRSGETGEDWCMVWFYARI